MKPCTRTIWTDDMDARLKELWPTHSLATISFALGLSVARVRRRAVNDLHLSAPTLDRLYQPSKQDWIKAATDQAIKAKVRPSDVMAGSRTRAISFARWRAWKAVLDENPHVSIAGVARISGFDHTSVLNGIARLAGRESNYTDPYSSRATGRVPAVRRSA